MGIPESFSPNPKGQDRINSFLPETKQLCIFISPEKPSALSLFPIKENIQTQPKKETPGETLKKYKEHVDQFPALNEKQTLQLFSAIEHWVTIDELKEKLLGTHPTTERTEKEKKYISALEDCNSIQEFIINANQQLVVSGVQKIKKYAPTAKKIEYAQIGLLNAVRSFNSTSGNFTTYAEERIEEALTEIPRSNETIAYKQDKEAAVQIKKSFMLTDLLKRTLKDSVAQLPDNETEIVRLYLGIGGRRALTPEQISINFGFNKSYVHDVLKDGLPKVIKNDKFCALASLYYSDESIRDTYKPLEKTQPAIALFKQAHTYEAQRKEEAEKKAKMKELPSGTKWETYKFLEAAKSSGIFEAIDEMQQKLIEKYFYEEVSVTEAARELGITSDKNAARKILLKNLQIIWEKLPHDLKEAYPKETVVSLKSKKGRARTPEFCENVSAYWKGKPKSPQMIQALKGRVQTPEEKAKRSKGMLLYRERQRQQQLAESNVIFEPKSIQK